MWIAHGLIWSGKGWLPLIVRMKREGSSILQDEGRRHFMDDEISLKVTLQKLLEMQSSYNKLYIVTYRLVITSYKQRAKGKPSELSSTTCVIWDVANPPHDPDRWHLPTHPSPELQRPWDIFFFFSPRSPPPPSHPVDADTEVRQEQPGSPHNPPPPTPPCAEAGLTINSSISWTVWNFQVRWGHAASSAGGIKKLHQCCRAGRAGWLGRPSAAAVPLAKSTRICSPPCGCNHPHFDQTSTRFLTSLRQAPLKELSGYFARYNLLLLFRRRGTLGRAVIGAHSRFFSLHLFFPLQLHIARYLPRKCLTISLRLGSETLLERRAAAWHLRKWLQRSPDMIPHWLLHKLWYEIKAVFQITNAFPKLRRTSVEGAAVTEWRADFSTLAAQKRLAQGKQQPFISSSLGPCLWFAER